MKGKNHLRKRKNKAAAAAFALIFASVTLTALAGESESDVKEPAAQEETDETFAASDPFTYAADYDEIYEAFRSIAESDKARTSNGIMMIDSAFDMTSDAAVSASADTAAEEDILSAETYSAADVGDSADSVSADAGSEAAGYSSTNIQEYGVDEGDVVKTDGSYIYILRSEGEFLIVSADGTESEMQLLSRTSLESENDLTAKEMYLDGNVLSIITREYITSLTENGDGTYYTRSVSVTALYTYDITDRSEPVLSGKVTQEGTYSDSRKAGDYIYLFSTYYPSLGDSLDDSTIAPLLNGEEAKATDYYLPETMTSTECLVISSVDAASPSAFADNKILVSGADHFYVSTENIYVVNENYENSNTVTEITKFHYEDGQITGVAAGSVTGYLNDSFSMNEYDGTLRLVTTYYGDDISPTASVTDWTEHNALYILDASMKQLSVISDLAAGETVRSARFLGETGYFVTFEQTDPLFSVDLSDPEDPQILSELKISGFSSYLHFYGEDLLLGLGYEADESTGSTTGLKLSMFDISDPSNVTEAAKYVIDGVTWCESLSNYKSILVSAGKNIIGFYLNDRFLICSYEEEEGFTQELIYDFYTDGLAGKADSSTMRGLYIGDTLYLAGSTFVIRFDMSSGYEKTQVLTFE
ncbi:MAG: beta-propeller domain-containing protein [Clostridiales bacterium]|nr:beta-propeller domain-containing protein [Clostridiales bacterium]